MGHVDFKEEIVFRAAQIVSLVSFVALVTLFVLAAKGLLQTTSASPVILVSIAAVLVVSTTVMGVLGLRTRRDNHPRH